MTVSTKRKNVSNSKSKTSSKSNKNSSSKKMLIKSRKSGTKTRKMVGGSYDKFNSKYFNLPVPKKNFREKVRGWFEKSENPVKLGRAGKNVQPVKISPNAITYNQKLALGSNTLSVENALVKEQNFINTVVKEGFTPMRPTYMGSKLEQAEFVKRGDHHKFQGMTPHEAKNKIANTLAGAHAVFDEHLSIS